MKGGDNWGGPKSLPEALALALGLSIIVMLAIWFTSTTQLTRCERYRNLVMSCRAGQLGGDWCRNYLEALRQGTAEDPQECRSKP